MSLTVVSVAHPFAPVAADSAGGAEQVVAAIDQALVGRGHRSIVLAAAGSRVAGELLALPPAGERIDEAARAAVHARLRAMLGSLLGERRVDLVHLHGVDFDSYVPWQAPAVVVTLHLPLGIYAPGSLMRLAEHVHFVPVSRSQADSAPRELRLLPPIANGIALGAYRPVLPKGDYALAVGRISPEKVVHLALEAARHADAELVLAGQAFPYREHRRYFSEEIEPRLDARRRWIGAVGGARRRRLLGRARCLLVPSLVPETSSLAAMEALASGTPVIAFRSGALPELVDHGSTGFLVAGVRAMGAAIRDADRLDPARCRRVAERRFDADVMTAAYLELFRRLVRDGSSATPRRAHVDG